MIYMDLHVYMHLKGLLIIGCRTGETDEPHADSMSVCDLSDLEARPLLVHFRALDLQEDMLKGSMFMAFRLVFH